MINQVVDKDKLIEKLLLENKKLSKTIDKIEKEKTNLETKVKVHEHNVKALKIKLEKEKLKSKKLKEENEKLLKLQLHKDEIANRDAYNKYNSQKDSIHKNNNRKSKKGKPVKRGRKPNGKNHTSSQPVDRIKIIKPSIDNCLQCGAELISIGADETKKIYKSPKTYECVLEKSVKKVCPNGCCNKIYQEIKNDPFGKSPCTSSFVADILTTKYSLGVPLDRLSRHLHSVGMKFSTQCLTNYAMKSAEILTPLYNELKKGLVNNSANVLHSDETPIKVLENMNRKKSYMFVYTTSFYDQSIYIYEYSEDRTTANLTTLLEGYKGTIIVDGYAGYNKFEKLGIKIQRDLVHLRRYFTDVLKGKKEKAHGISKAKKVIEKFDNIFKLEAKIKEEAETTDEIKIFRETDKYQKAIKELKESVYIINPTPDSLLEDAVRYFKNMEDEMFTYLTDGHISCENNICERAVKPFSAIRKNSLFAKTEKGATTIGVILSIVQTAKANALSVPRYLEYLFDNHDKLSKNINSFLPWSEELPDDLKIDFDFKR